jgi:hypothetical protein
MFGADAWVVTADSPGSFLSTEVIPASVSEEVARSPGVEQADLVIVSRTTLPLGPVLDVKLIGYETARLGRPPLPRAGRSSARVKRSWARASTSMSTTRSSSPP